MGSQKNTRQKSGVFFHYDDFPTRHLSASPDRGASAATRTFTVRKVASGVGVERIFPLESPFIESIELNKVGKVRRARIFYLRELSGKKARIKEKKVAAKNND